MDQLSPSSPASLASSFAQGYRAARQAVAVADRSSLGRLRIRGKDALDLLNRLSTNKLDTLAVGCGAPTVFTTEKGRIVDWVQVFHLPEGGPSPPSGHPPGEHRGGSLNPLGSLPGQILVLTSPETPKILAEWIDRYTFLEEATVQDMAAETALLSLLGPKAVPVAEALFGSGCGELPPYGCTEGLLGAVPVVVLRSDPLGVFGLDLLIEKERREGLEQALREAGAPWGIQVLEEEALELLRIAAGVPRYGREIGPAYNPLEASLEASISSDKGCYIGQEVIARLQTYQKVQRRLVGLSLEADLLLASGSPVFDEGREIGKVTSAARGLQAGRVLALAYVRLPYAHPGRLVLVQASAEHRVAATVVALPFEE